MKQVLKAIVIILFSAIVLMTLATATFIGFGVLLAQWLPLSLFQASGLAIGATLAVAAVIHVITAITHLRQYEVDDDFEDDDESDMFDGTPVFANRKFSNANRNDYCPCGSGKKFKNCCENSTGN
jgi:uncharacterized protein YchJ